MTTPIGAVKKLTDAVEIQTPRIPAPFTEQFELTSHGMVSPDSLLEFDASNVGGNGAALATVQPSIGTPGQRVGYAVRVLHAETSQQNFWICVWNIVAIAIGIEQQVWHVQNENSAMPERQTGGQIQSVNEIASLIIPAVSIRV
jgi:hypothetical protein